MTTSLDRKFFGSTRGSMVTLLRRRGLTVDELAAEVGLTNNGVRAHLATLEQASLRLPVDPGGRGSVPQGLRTRSRPAARRSSRGTRRVGDAAQGGGTPHSRGAEGTGRRGAGSNRGGSRRAK